MFLFQSHIFQEEGKTTMVSDFALKTIGASRSHNTSDTSSRKERKKDSTNNPVYDEGDDYIASHRK